MRKLLTFIVILTCFLNYSCRSNELKGNLKHDYTTSGALGDDCFQVIITTAPDRELKTMTEQRENAFIKAKNSITSETEKQMIAYYTSAKSAQAGNLSEDVVNILKKKSAEYSKKGIIDQEYYLMDNSAVLIYRIFDKGIKNRILNN